MRRVKHCDGFLGCRTSKDIESKIKSICNENNREVSEVINYLCRIFINDVNGVKSTFINGGRSTAENQML